MKKQRDDTTGLIVFIGGSKRPLQPILVAWTPRGNELHLLERVSEFSQERLCVLGTEDAARDDVDRFRASQRKSKQYGDWYSRTAAFERAMSNAIRPRHRVAKKLTIRRAA